MHDAGAFEPYRIEHVDIAQLVGVTVPAENALVICWAGKIPLAQCWVSKNDPPLTAQQFAENLRLAAAPALEFYRSSGDLPMENGLNSSPFTHSEAGADNKPLSVIICTRNRPESLKRCIASLQLNTDLDFELIVVDNNPSDDRTREAVAGYPQVRYIRELRRGVSYARNTGVYASRHSLIAYVDDDVVMPDNWISGIKSAFDEPELMAITGLLLPYSLDTPSQLRFEQQWSFGQGYVPIEFGGRFFHDHSRLGVPVWSIGAGASMAFRRQAFAQVGGFDARLGGGASGCSEDSELWYRLLAGGWKCRYVPRIYAYHDHRRTNDSLREQLFGYMRGHVCGLLIQYEKTRQRGNLARVFNVLPKMFYHRIRNRFSRGDKLHLGTEIRGAIAGLFYYFFHRKDTGYPNPFFLPYAVQQPVSVDRNTLVSVIIPCHSRGFFLAAAIDSVLQQDHSSIEIIVVDDGTDRSVRAICENYPRVKYVHSLYQGVAVKRNVGVQHAKGDFLLFLDEDDWLVPAGVSTNLRYFSNHPQAAFVSGGFDRVDEQGKFLSEGETKAISQKNYEALLRGNYIGMEGNVLYKRAVFDCYHYSTDPRFAVGEDYLLHLQLARYFPVVGHIEKIALYRIHRTNTSSDRKRMLKATLAVLTTQKKLLFYKSEWKAYREGRGNWIEYYLRRP